jgi:archaellum component FlaC
MWIAKQMIDFQKTTFDNTFNAVAILQDHTEKMAGTILEQANWLPEESRRVMGEWTEMVKKGRNDMKTAVDENYNNLADLLAPQTNDQA